MPTEEERNERLREGNEEVASVFGYSITRNEIRAFELGVIGIFPGIGYGADLISISITFSLVAIGAAHGVQMAEKVGLETEDTFASMVKESEPWWFTISYSLFFFLGFAAHNNLPVN